MNRRSILLLASIGIAAALAGALLAQLRSPPVVALESGTWLPQRRALAPFQLRDLAGRPFDTATLAGHPTLLFFGFTACPDVCPTTLATLAQMQRSAPLPHAQVVFVTIDPERDSADNLRVYLAAFSQDFVGLRGSNEALAPLLKSLGAIAARQSLPDGSYTMDHSATLYLLDTQGRLAAVFSPPFDATRLAADLQRIAAADQL
jgi:protein SCO1/2